jgi:hypothetical protein
MNQKSTFPLWLKVSVTLFLCVFVSVYWFIRGPANFLWFSDIALIAVVISLWTEKSLPASMLAVGVLLFEFGWNLDFLARLIWGSHLFNLNATEYMFSDALPLVIRVLSLLLHVLVPALLLYVLYRLGYDRRAWKVQTLLAWIILPVSYFFTDPESNINWAYGIGGQQTWVSELLYLGMGMLLLPLLIYFPTHYILKRYF